MSTADPCAEPVRAHPAARARRPADSEVVALAGVAALGVACVLSPAGIEDGPVLCPFRAVTGLPCPGCGLTRSWVYLAHGWWRESWLAHPFGAALLVAVLALGVVALRARVTGRPAPDLGALVRHPAVRVVLIGWLAFALVRLVLAV